MRTKWSVLLATVAAAQWFIVASSDAADCGCGNAGLLAGPPLSVGSETCCHDSVLQDTALRQCRIAYFSPHYSDWVEADVMVSYKQASAGLSTCALIPGDGYQRGWITKVYTLSNVTPPKFAGAENVLPPPPVPTKAPKR